MNLLTPTFLTFAKIILLVAVVPAIVGFVIVLAERRLMGFMQVRLGPNRVGPQGTLQGLADLLKLVTKEDLTPAQAEKAVYFMAPVLTVIPALTALALIPFGPSIRIGKVDTPLWVTDVNVGLLILVGITSIGVYGIILGGWASNNKYSLLGGLRSAAQLVSYEVPMGLALVSVLLMTRSLSLVEIVQRQQKVELWFAFPGLLAFFIYFVAGVAETNRNPFDLPEAESELVSGFNTEYSGVKFAFFFLGEYTAMMIISCVAVTVFWGGWLRPFPNVHALDFLDVVPPVIWFVGDRPGEYRARGVGAPSVAGTYDRHGRALVAQRRTLRLLLPARQAPANADAARSARGRAIRHGPAVGGMRHRWL